MEIASKAGRKHGRHPERALSAAFVRTVTKPGRYCDGQGLYLLVTNTGARCWVQRLTIQGRRRELGLGGFPVVSLAEAREQALANRKLARTGGDPLAEKRKHRGIPTFAEAAAQVIAMHRPAWKDGGKSAAQWESSLRAYAFPHLGRRRVSDVTTADVMTVLTPIWHARHETARRVRQRIGAVMKWAIANGYRSDNPAGEAIAAALPKRNGALQHQRALPHAEVGAAIVRVRESDASLAAKLCFEFLVLTACRSGEVRGARWEEIDWDTATWTVPAARMKAGREHRIPLTARALAVLQAARELPDGSGLVFPSARGGELSDNTLSKLLRELGIAAVPHGFRSSFRDWCGECATAPREVAEAALAHVVRNRAEAAYARSDLFVRRRQLMDEWATYLNPAAGRAETPVGHHG